MSSGTAGTVEHYGDTACIIYNDGRVLWVPPAQFVGLCELDFRLWPFDTQICNMTFGSWTYHGEQIDMQLGMSQDMVWKTFNRVNFLYVYVSNVKKLMYRGFIRWIFSHLIYLVKIFLKMPQKIYIFFFILKFKIPCSRWFSLYFYLFHSSRAFIICLRYFIDNIRILHISSD